MFHCDTFRCISVFLNETDYLEKSLGLVMEVLEITLSVQRQHIYLEVSNKLKIR